MEKNLDQIDYSTEIFMHYVMTSPGRSFRALIEWIHREPHRELNKGSWIMSEPSLKA
jgi:hypothetical protein